MMEFKYIIFIPILEAILLNCVTLANINYQFCQNTSICICAYPTPSQRNTFELRCPQEVSNVKISLKPSSFLDLECIRKSENILVPSIKFGKIREVRIGKCSVKSNNETFVFDLINKLGIQTNKIIVEHFENIMSSSHLHGLKDLDHLKLLSNKFLNLTYNYFNGMDGLRFIDIKSNAIDNPISEDLFINLKNLKRISFGANKNKTIPPNLFKNQIYLKKLDLYGCNIKSLQKDMFNNNTLLEILNLMANNIEIIEPNVFDRLTMVSKIDLRNNNIVTLPENLLGFNKRLEMFFIVNMNKKDVKLPSGFLANLPDLKIVQMSMSLSELPENSFERSSNLYSLNLGYNKLTNLPKNIFEDQRNLIKLNLENNLLNELDSNVFKNMVNLTELVLSNNQLSYLSTGLFEHLINLKTLLLNNNKLERIHQNAFQYNQEIREINFSNNHLKFIGYEDPFKMNYTASALYNLIYLTTLNLSNNSLTKITSDWRLMNNLRNLDLSYNKFTEIEYANLNFINNFTVLVNLEYNEIKTINFAAIALKSETYSANNNMNEIRLDNNPINCDCNLLHFVQYLKDQKIFNHQKFIKIKTKRLICAAPESFRNASVSNIDVMKLLCSLDTGYEKISKMNALCTYWTRSIDKNTIINCTDAQLTSVPIIVDSFPKIELHVENNNITKLPETLQYAKTLNHIYAQNNQINTLDEKNLPPNLETLFLNDNQLTRLNKSLLTHLSSLQYLKNITFGANPWSCECDVGDFFDFVLAKEDIISDVNEIRCKDDNNKTLRGLNIADICKKSAISASTLIIATAVIACVICIIISLVCFLYRRELAIMISPIIKFFRKEDEDKLYDAFISFAHQDEDFILEHIRPKLEDDYGYKLNLHFRDWVPGLPISDQIVNSVMDSRRTLVVLSTHFIESIWGQMEFRVAHHNAIKEGKGRVIIIIYGDIDNSDKIDSDLKAYLKMNTYIKWGDPWFWRRLVHALPNQKKVENKKKSYLKQNTLQGKLNDKFGLMQPELIPPLTTPPADTANKNPLLEKLYSEIITIEKGSLIINTNNIYKM